jgi:hypothetical protein
VFEKLRDAQLAMYGNYGAALDPRSKFQSSGGFGADINTPMGTQLMRTKRSALMQEEQEYGSSGGGSTKSYMVEDKAWPVTLSEILGSRMLSPEQLRMASIQNIDKYIDVSGMKQHDGLEMKFLFQRMMLEGFIRGVDITRDIEAHGRPKVVIKEKGYNSRGNPVVGSAPVGGNNGTVSFDDDIWYAANDARKLTAFYHEFGHNLLNKHHQSHDGIIKSGGSGPAAKKMLTSKGAYNALMNDLFTSHKSVDFAHLKSSVNKNIDPKFDPSWYPSATGVDSGYGPGSAGGDMSRGGDMTNNIPISNNYTTYIPPTISMSGGANGTIQQSKVEPTVKVEGEGGGGPELPESEATPTASSFSQNVQQMANTGIQAPSLQGIAGNLVNRAG